MKERITIDQEKDKLSVTIKAFREDNKQKMLMLWIVLFSICGLAIFSQFFEAYDPGTKVFFGVYIAFWLFFEFKVIYAYRWRTYGLEYITIEQEEVLLTKQIGKRGVTQKYSRSDIRNLRLFENSDTGFFKSMNDSYWNINKYTLVFDVHNRFVPFGIDLTKKQATDLLKLVQQYFN